MKARKRIVDYIAADEIDISEMRWLLWDEIESLSDKNLKKIIHIMLKVNVIELFLSVDSQKDLDRLCALLDEARRPEADKLIRNNSRYVTMSEFKQWVKCGSVYSNELKRYLTNEELIKRIYARQHREQSYLE